MQLQPHLNSVTGRKGTIFDGILLFLVFEGETKVYPLAFLVFENDFELKEKAEELIPGIELKE